MCAMKKDSKTSSEDEYLYSLILFHSVQFAELQFLLIVVHATDHCNNEHSQKDGRAFDPV